MLPKKNRLTTKEFSEVFSDGKTFSSNAFTLRYTKKKNIKNTKCSFVVSKKIAKKAVERNKLRRAGYFILSEIKDSVSLGSSCIFFLKKEGKNLSPSEIKIEIKNLLRKAGVLNNIP